MIEFLKALLPSAGVLFIFVVVIRALVQADRRERAAAGRISAAMTTDSAGPPDGTSAGTSDGTSAEPSGGSSDGSSDGTSSGSVGASADPTS